MVKHLTITVRLCVTSAMHEELGTLAENQSDDSGAPMKIGKLARKFVVEGLAAPPKPPKLLKAIIPGSAIGIRLSRDHLTQLDQLVTKYRAQFRDQVVSRSMVLRGFIVAGMARNEVPV